MSELYVLGLLLVIGVVSVAWAADVGVRCVGVPDTAATNSHCVGNREPLLASPLIKLPIGAIEPRGWLRGQLEREADGFVGHLAEISGFLKKDGNAWLSADGEGHSPWEEVPYWLKGFGDLGYVLGDERVIKEARVWIEGVLGSQREDGYFGPRANLTALNGEKPDLWPHMVMLNVLQSYYEYSGDKRVLDLMTAYFRWQLAMPEEDFLEPFWQNQRGADNLASVLWLYNRTGEKWLLELGHKIHRNTADWTTGVANWHGVNIVQSFRGPANYYVLAKDEPALLAAVERNYQEVWNTYGQVPGGLFGADENCRTGYVGPRQAAETCTMVEFMLSCEMLLGIGGELRWADRCEDVAFNSLPAAMTADLKALRYLTAPNMPQSDKVSKSPGIQNGGPMLRMNPHDHRCCQHNVSHGWPYFAEHLWMATPDRGLAFVFYAASVVKAKVGDGTEVAITAETDYPFDETVKLRVATPTDVRFPLYLRVPGWCKQARVRVNGAEQSVKAEPRTFVVIDRTWADGDVVELTLPMEISVERYEASGGCVSVKRGPLTYSLKIGERYERSDGTDEFPAYDVFATTPWNYGLVLDDEALANSFEFVREAGPLPEQPFEVDVSPVKLKAKGRRLPAWQLDSKGLIHEVQQSPARTDEPIETITLIPMGAARLRVSAFPIASDRPDAHERDEPLPSMPATASHVCVNDSLEALTDGLTPRSSNDQRMPRFTWWSHKNSTEWVEIQFDEPREVSKVRVYWFDDTGDGECRVPASWRLLYVDGAEPTPVEGASEYGTAVDRFNEVTFTPVKARALRIEARLQQDASAGILEWEIG